MCEDHLTMMTVFFFYDRVKSRLYPTKKLPATAFRDAKAHPLSRSDQQLIVNTPRRVRGEL